VRGDLVAGFVCIENGGLLVVDAACVGQKTLVGGEVQSKGRAMELFVTGLMG
jgi:hypothetical protein